MADAVDNTTSRRNVLSTLAAAPIAFIPVHVSAVHPDDAAVAAKAAEVRALLAASERATLNHYAIDDRIGLEAGSKPQLDRTLINQRCIDVLAAFAELTPQVDAAVAAKRREMEQRVHDASDAWEERKDALCRRYGYDEALALDRRLMVEVDAALCALGAMPVRSLAGALAKVDAFRDVDVIDDGDDAHAAFACAIVRDLLIQTS